MAQNDLKKYQNKRHFEKTSEPSGKNCSKKSTSLFVIQKHDASQLHYDFRLQYQDVLLSWAVPKGLSTAANEKRLAIRTENHPLDYADFEGVIPEGEYGAGTVLVWDKGEYEPIIEEDEPEKTMEKALKDGSLKFKLNGQKIQGGYAMARINTEQDREQWVIFKLDDDDADARRNPVHSEPDSVLTGRSLKDIGKEHNDEKH
ncbi:DNA ligase D, 3''-phosphoesterase domain protein [Legionella spiritensis]|uniref:DNA ligase D, 3''-phosphoesterase domain protein n=2 Tax=Legionella spiritensis TaxID=452 RepID=A0A0W0Z5C7_LEGSP|nr:DNA ligase D, 3''-phosphoesterase domain protein [Legionella spiritensis]SNV46571.1 Putative DNA ligase-like protein Rv0938/MT0965 [Legionella spiritensis]